MQHLTPFLASGLYAAPLLPDSPFLFWVTNSTVVAVIATLIVIILARRATARMSLVPNGAQNTFEAIVEALFETVEGIVGAHLAPKVFSFLATIFIFIISSNYFGLLPGVGTIGFGEHSETTGAFVVHAPLFRPATADINNNLAMSAVFMVLWLVWTLQEMGFVGFIVHTFGPKGGLTGFMKYAIAPIFVFVGVIEIISIVFRPFTLSLRLFGNIFAGETLLAQMISLGQSIPIPILNTVCSVVFALPFYFMELLVGFLQAFVFMLLCAVYIQLSTDHGDEEGHGHAKDGHDAHPAKSPAH